ncbi:MAG: hypothetical protein ACKOXK_08630 [Chakrabartia sp.]
MKNRHFLTAMALSIVLVVSGCAKPDGKFAEMLERMAAINTKVEAIIKREKICALDDDVIKLSASINGDSVVKLKNDVQSVIEEGKTVFPDGMKPTDSQIQEFKDLNTKVQENVALMAARIMKSQNQCNSGLMGMGQQPADPSGMETDPSAMSGSDTSSEPDLSGTDETGVGAEGE